MRHRMAVAFVALAIAGAALASGCTTNVTSTPKTERVAGLPASQVRFATLKAVPLTTDSPPYKGSATPRSLSGVKASDSVKEDISNPKVARTLESQGFAVVPGQAPQFYMAYTGAPYDGTPVYVTTDVAYHMWHLAFDKTLRELEQTVLLPKLERLTELSLANARKQSKELAGTPLAADALKVEQLMQVQATLLGLPAGELGPDAKREVSLIRARSENTSSPITGAMIDYSLFTPRGHYTRNPVLTRFFLGMSLMGQSAFLVREPAQVNMGVLASRVMSAQGLGDAQTEQLWTEIYEPTAFLVGTADDYTPFELVKTVEKVAPGAMKDPAKLTKEELAKIGPALLAFRPVRIDPEKASVRLMGVRFVVDSYMLDQLTYPNVGTTEKPREIASAMDIPAAFGSDFAYGVQKAAGQTDYTNYDSQLQALRKDVADRPVERWGGTVYDSWLWSLQPMWLPHGGAFPDYMRTPAWSAKAHQSGLGSYAELKHDTLLFAKQYVAEGEGPSEKAAPRNWVEPDPVVYQRLNSIVLLMQSGLESRGLLTSDTKKLFADLTEMYGFFSRIAEDELANKPISEQDNTALGDIGSQMEGLWWQASDRTDDGASSADKSAAIVADIGRGGQQVVEVATGSIDNIFVIVPDDRGGFAVARGGVYSYYEFLQPASDRLTDEVWRQKLEAGQVPPRPGWEGVLFAR